MADMQRQRVYDAERTFMGWQKGSVLTKRIEEVPAIQTWVDDLIRNPEFRVRWTQTSVVVHDGRRRRRAGGSIGHIWMPRWSRSVGVILHEVAHGLSDNHHGAHFCRTFVQLIEIVTDRHTSMLFEGYLRGRDCEVAPERPPTRKAVAACQRVKPFTITSNGKVYHTHPDRMNTTYGPTWEQVHSRTGICRFC